MPSINWFAATLLVLSLCGIAIAAPFVVGLVGS